MLKRQKKKLKKYIAASMILVCLSQDVAQAKSSTEKLSDSQFVKMERYE